MLYINTKSTIKLMVISKLFIDRGINIVIRVYF